PGVCCYLLWVQTGGRGLAARAAPITYCRSTGVGRRSLLWLAAPRPPLRPLRSLEGTRPLGALIFQNRETALINTGFSPFKTRSDPLELFQPGTFCKCFHFHLAPSDPASLQVSLGMMTRRKKWIILGVLILFPVFLVAAFI